MGKQSSIAAALRQPDVSIQLVFPTSGKDSIFRVYRGFRPVSIQLVFPTSGKGKLIARIQQVDLGRFHSISFPNEWESSAKTEAQRSD